MPSHWKKTVLLFLTMGFLYALGVFYVYVFIDHVIFSPVRYSKSYQYKISNNYTPLKIFHPNQEFIEALLFNHSSEKKQGVVLFLHGANGSVEDWSPEVDKFQKLGYDVLLPDYRGYGKSPGKPSELNIYQDALTSYYWLEKITSSDSIVIYGNGLGAVAAVNVGAVSSPRTIILENPLLSIRDWIKNRYRAFLIHRELKYDFKLSDYISQCKSQCYIIYNDDNNQFENSEIESIKKLMLDPRNIIKLKVEKGEKISTNQEFLKILEKILSN